MKQRRAIRTASLTLALAASLTAATLVPAAYAQPSGVRADQADGGHGATRAALRAMVEAAGQPGIGAAARDARGDWFGTAGAADTGTGRKYRAKDHFRVASITKVFIATVVLQLEAEGRLRLDDTVEQWLPGLLQGNGYDGRKVTLRQLLNHTSGIANYTEDRAFINNAAGPGFLEHRYDTHTPEELVAVALKHAPPRDPKLGPYYSNTGFVIAGMVIEKVTGRSYGREVARRILHPLKLRDTSFPGTSPYLPKSHPVAYSKFHQSDPAPIHDATEQNMTWLGASGDAISTTGDLNRFQRALVQGKLLPQAQMKDMLTEVPVNKYSSYGLGVEFATLSCGVKVVGKSGRTNGSLSAMVGTQDGKHQLAFNVNGDWMPNGQYYVDVVEAEFCGKLPHTPAKPSPTASAPAAGPAGASPADSLPALTRGR
ncbi:serine hydrolase domain-containing protein [Streptomyces sp. NPDC058657]|uniref:serine hydrolase domain-containing protein n=1 Tax=unclassified Streptomyces TaxID=2593676 RepID=UPI00366194AB